LTDIFARTKLLLGESFEKLSRARVLVVGVGGVGGFVAEFLARAGVGGITIVDFDTVEPTNTNRQVIALQSTVGRLKTGVLAQRLKDINPDLEIRAISKRFNEQTKDEVFDGHYDFVVDAIDSLGDKVLLIETALSKGLRTISATGAGNRYGIPDFEVKDIYKTSDDGLAKALRKKLREKGVTALPCVCSKTPAEKVDGAVGSISYYPAACACVLAAYVVNNL